MKPGHTSFHGVLKACRNLAMVVSCLILVSCAGTKLEKPVEKAPEVKQEAEQIDVPETGSYIELEPGIDLLGLSIYFRSTNTHATRV